MAHLPAPFHEPVESYAPGTPARQRLQEALDALGRLSGSLFSIQLGQVVGQLATEVTSGSDVGFPVLDGSSEHELRAVLIPQNVAAFSEGLETPMADVLVYLAAREIAHARLFKHAKWLKLALVSGITAYANGISINSEVLRDAMEDLDLSDPQAIQRMMGDGALIPPKTEDQIAALARIETLLALIDGWVDTVTDRAVSRIPTKDAIGEMVRRNRAAGRPGEKALAGLIGIEARPRRLREAAAMWRAIDDAVGGDVREVAGGEAAFYSADEAEAVGSASGERGLDV
jgi:putative hydrolase